MARTGRVILARIDDGCRAKLVCLDCRGETYVRILWDHTETSVAAAVETLVEASANHSCVVGSGPDA